MPHLTSPNQQDIIKIAVLGAAGGIGQSLSLLIKEQIHYSIQQQSTKRVHLALYDVAAEAVQGVAADLSHIDTPITMSCHAPNTDSDITDCLTDASMVIIPAGVPRKPGMTRDDLFNINAKIISQLTDSIAECCDLSKVFVLVISNPVNTLIPVMHYRFKYAHAKATEGTGIDKRIFGITKLDAVRASTFLRGAVPSLNTSLTMPYVPVIGGHSGDTIIPLFSQVPTLTTELEKETIDALIHRVQYGGDEIVKAKNGKGSATLSMAHAAFQVLKNFMNIPLGNALEIESTNYIALRAFDNEPVATGAIELLSSIQNCNFFAIPIKINASGVCDIDCQLINHLNDLETNHLLPTCISQLTKNIEIGESFVKQSI